MSGPNFESVDPFVDEGDLLEGNDEVGTQANNIHIRIQQRNGRKTLTTLQGISKEYNLKKILKEFKKDFACNGNLVDHEEFGQVIQLQGDQRSKIATFLIDAGIPKATIKVHGF